MRPSNGCRFGIGRGRSSRSTSSIVSSDHCECRMPAGSSARAVTAQQIFKLHNVQKSCQRVASRSMASTPACILSTAEEFAECTMILGGLNPRSATASSIHRITS